MKGKVKMAVDMLMTAALLFLMGYQFWGPTRIVCGEAK